MYVLFFFFVVVFVFINVYWFVVCMVSFSCSDVFFLVYWMLVFIFVFLIIGVIVWIFMVNWYSIELIVSMIGVVFNVLLKNLGLFGIFLLLILGLFVYYVFIVVFLMFVSLNGKIVLKENYGEYYCVWK